MFNVVARFGPKGVNADGPLLVIGAHYDSHGDPQAARGNTPFTRDTHTPGA